MSDKRRIPKVADRSLSRLINQTAIIDRVYSSKGISKAQLAKELGISKPAITSNVESLIEAGLIVEKGEGEAAKKGGRKPIILRFNSGYCYIGAVDISLREPICAIADLNYNLLSVKRIVPADDATPEQRKEMVKEAFIAIMEDKGISLNKLGIIIISHPGVIEETSHTYYSHEQHHKWTEIGLKEYLETEFKTKVSIRNDVNTAAIGEMNFGCAKKPNDIIYVSVGNGLGAGIIIDGKLYEGPKRAAGEIGSTLHPTGEKLENRVVLSGLIKRVQDALVLQGIKHEKLTFMQIVELLKSGNGVVGKVVYRIGWELGIAFYNACMILDIKTVIVGGDYIELGGKLFEGINDALRCGMVFQPTVIQSELKYTAGIYGCFVIGREKIIKPLLDNK